MFLLILDGKFIEKYKARMTTDNVSKIYYFHVLLLYFLFAWGDCWGVAGE